MAKYQITRKIGTGAFGNVYLLQTGRGHSEKFALKVVNTLRLRSKDGECGNEGTLMLKLCHAHLVHCYDAFICSPHLYLIMELCCHGSLEQFLCGRRSLVPEKQVLSWIAQLADVLRYLHALKVIHRDLKPANIFLDESQSVKLGDLGVARELDHTEQERHTTAGTLPYMSPEAFSGLPYNYKTDVWSLGCCIHEAMTLQKTFQGQSWTELHNLITSGKVPEMPSLYQRNLKKLILSLLDVDSNRRPDALEILLTLFQIQGRRFSSEPSQPVDASPFDHKQICQIHKLYEISSSSETIQPLKAGGSVDDTSTRLSTLQGSRVSNQTFSDGDPEPSSYDSDKVRHDDNGCGPVQDTLHHTESTISHRPLPVPKARKKKKILKSLKLRRKTEQLEISDKDTSVLDTTKDDIAIASRLSPPTVSSCPNDLKPSQDSTHTDGDHSSSSVGSQHSQPSKSKDNWTDDYMEALTRDSTKWLRSRFKPKPTGSKFSISNPSGTSTDDYDEEEEGDEDEAEVACGLVTLFTQSQTAVYINNNRKPKLPADLGGATNSNTPENELMGIDLSESALKAAENTIKVFQGEDPHILKLMLIKILGLRGFILYGKHLL